MEAKIEGRWTGYTFFELHDPACEDVESYYQGQRPTGTWAAASPQLPEHLRMPHGMQCGRPKAAPAKPPQLRRVENEDPLPPKIVGVQPCGAPPKHHRRCLQLSDGKAHLMD